MPRAQRVTGIVDFGDMVFSHTVNDLAIAMAYAALDKPDPLGAAAAVASGYHAMHPLTEDEIAALFGLMGMRLCLSVCVAAAAAGRTPRRGLPGHQPGADSRARCRRSPPFIRGSRTTGCARRAASRPSRTRLAWSSGCGRTPIASRRSPVTT